MLLKPTPEEAVRTTKRFYETRAVSYAQRTRELSLAVIPDAFTRRLVSSARIIDLGSGSGRDLKYLKQRGYRPVGIDYSASLAAEAAAFSGCSVIVGDIRELPVRMADGAIIVGTLSHFENRETYQILQQLADVLEARSPVYVAVKHGAESKAEGSRWMHYFQPAEFMQLVEAQACFELQEMWITISELEAATSWLNVVITRTAREDNIC